MYTLRSGFALETINYLERVLQNLDIIGLSTSVELATSKYVM
jgi:hypothetical protein